MKATNILLLICILTLAGCRHTGRAPGSVDQSPHSQATLRNSVLFYELLRDPDGQYADHYDLKKQKRAEYSSVAATGMGLVVLTIGDQMGITDHANEKAIATIEYLIKRRDLRHAKGWYRHFFGKPGDPNTSEFSTIDTAILVAGAMRAGRYFEQKNGDRRVAMRARKLASLIQWDDAVPTDWALRNGWLAFGYEANGRPFTYVDAKSGKTRQAMTQVYSEYLLLPCVAKNMPNKKMKEFWRRHATDFKKYDRRDFGGNRVIVSQGNHKALPHFVFQFPYYLCPDLTKNPDFLEEMRAAARADKSRSVGHAWEWGTSAGSESIDGRTIYRANTLDDNAGGWINAPTIAGFIPAFPEAAEDLRSLEATGVCNARISHSGASFEIPWRCARTKNGYLKAERIEGVDFAPLILGLAAAGNVAKE